MAKGMWGKLTTSAAPPKPGSLLWQPWKVITWLNVKLYRCSGGRLFGKFDDAPMLVLHHRGAKSGEPRETPLVYLADGDRVVLIASMGGSPKNPAWYHNLRANPDVEVEIRGRRRPMRARLTDDAERAELWPRVTQIWPGYDDYQARTSRQIPVLVLEPR